ncbi:MAG: ribulose-phosphate 3-epimerase [Lachnospiraceae bacterium]|nr:ribulose-phosphate 3-epimerase [Lachnospiraceae bacterium]
MSADAAILGEKIILSPSLISVCDLCNIESCVRQLQEAGIRMLHVDILDGYFSPSMPLGLDTVRALRKKTDIFFDVHLMAAKNDFFLEELVDMGADQVVFHAETETHIDKQLNFLHSHGVRAGLALKPATNPSVLEYVLDKCDAVLQMLINPGFAQIKGEAQVSYADRKVRDLHEMIERRALPTKLILDGRISPKNIEDYGPEGIADIFVAGSTCLDRGDLTGSAERLLARRRELLGGN